jgi:hypothetical protein
LVLALALGAGIPTIANAQSAVTTSGEAAQYRVDMHIEQEGETFVMRKYVDGVRSRIEMDFDGEQMVTIQLGDAEGTTYTLMPAEKRAMKLSMAAMPAVPHPVAPDPVAPDSVASDPGAAAGQTDGGLSFIATETLAGKPADKYQVQMPDSVGFMWVDPATQLPVRMEAGGSTVEMRNYDFSPPAPELFQVPRGYEVMDMSDMMRSFSASGMVTGAVANSIGTQLGSQFGSNIGAGIGAGIGGALGGPIGAMVGRFVGERIGKAVGRKAGTAVAKPF